MSQSAPTAVERHACRLCGCNNLAPVLTLAATPPANAFQPTSAAAQSLERYPLEVRQCAACQHAQLAHVVSPEALFGDYVYVSGTSPAYVRHLQEFQSSAAQLAGLREDDLVVDIGSNDGTLLKHFQQAGQRVLGVDPARDIAAAANAAGVPTWNTFFSAEVAERIVAEHGRARLVAANNVCAHIDDLSAVVSAVAELLTDDGEFWFEVSYLHAVVSGTLFDTIYHEHLDYHRVEPLVGFLARHGLVLWDVEPIPTHGGSIRVRAARVGQRDVQPRVQELIRAERALGLHEATAWRRLAQQLADQRTRLVSLLDSYASANLTGAGYGAPAKATTLMHEFGLGADRLGFIVDDSPWKQGLYSPGLGIPVVSAQHARDHRPDFLLVLAWNFAEPIIQNNEWFTSLGGRFVVPLPELRVAQADNL